MTRLPTFLAPIIQQLAERYEADPDKDEYPVVLTHGSMMEVATAWHEHVSAPPRAQRVSPDATAVRMDDAKRGIRSAPEAVTAEDIEGAHSLVRDELRASAGQAEAVTDEDVEIFWQLDQAVQDAKELPRPDVQIRRLERIRDLFASRHTSAVTDDSDERAIWWEAETRRLLTALTAEEDTDLLERVCRLALNLRPAKQQHPPGGHDAVRETRPQTAGLRASVAGE